MKNKFIGFLLGLSLLGCSDNLPKIGPEIPRYMIATANNGKEFFRYYDTDKDGDFDLEYSYEIRNHLGIYYIGRFNEIREDLNNDGKFRPDEIILKNKYREDIVVTANNGKELIFFYDTDKDGDFDLEHLYKVIEKSGMYYAGELKRIRQDLNNNGKFDSDERIWKSKDQR